jgi:hypothetical protein
MLFPPYNWFLITSIPMATQSADDPEYCNALAPTATFPYDEMLFCKAASPIATLYPLRTVLRIALSADIATLRSPAALLLDALESPPLDAAFVIFDKNGIVEYWVI